MQHRCYFCKNGIEHIDYKESKNLDRYMTGWSRIRPASSTGVCAKHQRELTTAIKRARFLAMLPYVTR